MRKRSRQLKVQDMMLKVPAEIIEDSACLFAVRILSSSLQLFHMQFSVITADVSILS